MKKFMTIALLPLLLACAKADTQSPADYRAQTEMNLSEESARGAADKKQSNTTGTAAPASPERLVIYNAEMGLAVKDVQGTVTKLEGITEKYKGFVVSSSKSGQNTYFNPDSAFVELRIPSENLNEALDEIAALGKVKRRELTGQDVTAEFMDLQLRLESKEKLLVRLQELLAKAEDTKTALEVEKEINRVTLEMEQIKGQLIFLKDQISLSTVSVEIQKRHRPGPLGAVGYGIVWVVGRLFVLN